MKHFVQAAAFVVLIMTAFIVFSMAMGCADHGLSGIPKCVWIGR